MGLLSRLPLVERPPRLAASCYNPRVSLQLSILGIREASAWLRSPQTASKIRYIVSIGASNDPRQGPPHGYMDSTAKKLRLDFWDIHHPNQETREVYGPTPADVTALVRFAQAIDPEEEGYLLCQCSAGISRSSACAYVIRAVQLGPGQEKEALKEVLRARFNAKPNLWVLRLASGILGRDLSGPLQELLRVAANPKHLL